MMVTLKAGFLDKRRAVVSPETPALCAVSSDFIRQFVITYPTTTIFVAMIIYVIMDEFKLL